MKLKKYRRKREIPIGWKEIKLGDVFRTSSGATPLTTELSYYEGGNIPWINSGELASPYIYSTSNYITQKGFDNSSTEIYPKGTILVAMYGATAGKASMLKITACTNQAICAILPNDDYCPEFIKYNIDTLYEHLVGLSSGSARDNLSQAGLKELKLVLPKTKKEQENLIAVLSLLDSKIELNKQINDNLEAMAKQLYEYWFVQFDFPNEEGKPYKSSGGAMVWNKKLKREIPQGWSDCVLGDYIGRITNGLNPRKNFVLGSGNNYYVTIRSLVGTTIDWNNCERCDDEALSKINSRSQLQIGDIIFSAIGTIGRTYYILEEPTNWNISETSFTLRAKENVPNDFFYGMLRSNEIQIKADKAAMGSTLRCLVMNSLCSLQYIKIPSYMMKSFAAKVSPLYRQIHRNNKEIAELTKQRDELLPLLMNGQASVNYHLSDD